jgi:succinoglycan biosynthesis transport protein ExoP
MNDKNRGTELGIYKGGEVSEGIRAPTPFNIEQLADEDTHLRDYWNILLRRRALFLVLFLSAVTIVTLYTFIVKPSYTSTVLLRIDRENPNILSFKEIYQIERAENDYYQTQYKVLKSRNIAKRAMKKLSLENNQEFNSVIKRASKKNPELEDGIPPKAIDEFIKHVEVSPLYKSQLVNVSFTSRDPALSQKAANTIAESYIEFNVESKFDAGQLARKWLEEQIEIMKAKVEASEEKLNRYSAGNEMIFLEEKDGKDKQSLLNEKLAYISETLNTATADRIAKEALYREIKKSGSDNPTILTNELIQKLKEQYSSLEAEYFNQLKVYTPEYPKMKRIKGQMDSLARALAEEEKHIVNSIESDYRAALLRERELSKKFSAQKKDVLAFQDKMVQYQILKREADTNKELYNNLLQRLKEIGVSASMTATNIQVLDKAVFPKKPSSPNIPKNLILALLIGTLGGTGAVFFTEYLDNTVKDSIEMEKRLRLPALGLIPFQKPSEPAALARIACEDVKSPLAESFRSIGTFVLLSSAAKPPRSLLITSARQSEGKSTVASNTAIVLAGSLGRGLLMDADIRNPNLHRRLEVNNSTGLSTYLTGNMEFEGLIKPSGIPGLDIITSGPVPPNPSELLGSARMKGLIERLSDEFNFIIIDSPPVLGMTDSIYLGTFVDGVILVARSGQTPKNALAEAKKNFDYVNAKILGIVINGIKANDLNYGYYSYYYSSYYRDGRKRPKGP